MSGWSQIKAEAHAGHAITAGLLPATPASRLLDIHIKQLMQI
jgi:hypothetical protein